MHIKLRKQIPELVAKGTLTPLAARMFELLIDADERHQLSSDLGNRLDAIASEIIGQETHLYKW